MTRCPHCFHTLSDDLFAWVCRSGSCQTKPDPQASALHGTPVSTGPLIRIRRPNPSPKGWAPPERVECSACHISRVEACPDCRFDLPRGWRAGQATCIAMAGARVTGKTVYLGVLVKQLAQLAAELDTTLEPATIQTRLTYEKVYEKALFEERRIALPTPMATVMDAPQRQSLIYSIGVIKGVRRFLVFRDVAGEDLENDEADQPHLSFFQHADGVIFMFDPLRVPEVRDHLRDLVPEQLGHGGDPHAVLNKVLRLVSGGPAAIAVVLSKFDAMQALRSVSGSEWSRVMSNAGAAFLRDEQVTDAPYNESEGQLLHLEVRSLLFRLGAGPIATSLERPHTGQSITHRFFAVSALGEPTEGEALHARGITPFRCLDPLRWLLWDQGVLA